MKIDNCKGIAHVGLLVKDSVRSRLFYEDILGFKLVFERNDKTEAGDILKLSYMQLGDLLIEMISVPGFGLPADGCFQHLAIRVENTEEAQKKLEESGIEHDELVFSDSTFSNGSKWITFLGPDGEHLEFNEVLLAIWIW